MFKFLLKFFGDPNERALKAFRTTVNKINSLEWSFEQFQNEELPGKTIEFRDRFERGESLESLLPEAFALVRESAKRTIGQRHYDTQLLGGIALHHGKVTEMATGEGKTLVATLPVYLNAITGLGVHLVTVNDYLAKRDAQWMGPIYHLLGLSIGCLQHESAYLFDPETEASGPTMAFLKYSNRRLAYEADITYGTNNEFGFDYLRDNMVVDSSYMVQRKLNFAIVDEVDNILIDEARTPLIISGPAEEPTKLYQTVARLAKELDSGRDYALDEKMRSVSLTDDGISRVEQFFKISNLYSSENTVLTHYIDNALKAKVLFECDKEYVIQDRQIIIVDEFTGRLMPGRRFSEGLHQAIEAKEGVEVRRESITYATITLQNYFRMYQKLSGMTGTAATEAEELWKIYKLDVLLIPTNMPMIRKDLQDVVYKTENSKYKAVAERVAELHKQGCPVLVGTTSIEKSQLLGEVLKRRGVRHELLNAKFHEREASIVAQAGRIGAVTVATNMAGRGTDIVLGGTKEDRSSIDWQEEHNKVVELGGLHILGMERHEARRIDNQLRGRTGRQGDPGNSRFYVSLEDELMRRFGGDRIKGVMDRLGIEEDIPIENILVNKAVESSQIKVEAQNFDIRKHLVEYDDVANRQREVIYEERRKILEGTELKANIEEMIGEEIRQIVSAHTSANSRSDWDFSALHSELLTVMPLPAHLSEEYITELDPSECQEELGEYASTLYTGLEANFGLDQMRDMERLVMLRVIDLHWVEHLTAMQNLREGIGLHAYGQRDPLVMYKKEAHEMFGNMHMAIQRDIVRSISYSNSVANTGASSPDNSRTVNSANFRRDSASATSRTYNKMTPESAYQSQSRVEKVSRNTKCPCGSGKKYKRCHGVLV
jgi:preprotein translocase subunit SecA